MAEEVVPLTNRLRKDLVSILIFVAGLVADALRKSKRWQLFFSFGRLCGRLQLKNPTSHFVGIFFVFLGRIKVQRTASDTRTFDIV